GIQPPLPKEPPRNGGHPLRQERWRRDVTGDFSGLSEVVEVVALGPANREHERVCLFTPAGPTNALPIVEELLRRVRVAHRLQRPDIDPYFHRRSHRKEVDLFAFW